MSGSKKHNSIVFLTTLSVYLGLVLVGGASSPVLAQAALTRNFDIQEELEYKDDLDKKPDDEKIDFSQTLDEYYREVGRFIKDLQKLHYIEKLNLDYDKFEVNQLNIVPCNVNGDPVQTSKLSVESDNRWLEPALTDARYRFEGWNFLSDCQDDKQYQTGISTISNLKLSYDKSELKIAVSAFKSNQQSAEWLAEKFNQASKNIQSDEENKIVSQLHKFTTIKSENNQFFIITNLPRASIDSLLALKNANQAASEK